MFEATDTMESPQTYLKGDIAWVKLSGYWWPGEVTNEDELPSDLLSDFKKPPLVIVKFFDEDSYEYIKHWSNIYPYNCDKKTEFIKKGMAGFRAKLSHLAKFPKDIGTAEEKTNGDPNILSQPEFLPPKKINFDEIFGTPSPKKSTKGKTASSASKKSTSSKDNSQPLITHRRFLGNDDYKAYVWIQYPGKDGEADIDDEEIKKLDEEPQETYTCPSCGFKTERLGVLLMHAKMHQQGAYTTPKRKSKKPKDDVSDSETETQVVKPSKPKQRKKKEEVKSKPADTFANLLEEWDDTDDEMDVAKTLAKPKKSATEPKETRASTDSEESPSTEASKSAANHTVDSSPVPELPKTGSTGKNTQDDIKNCFDFDEEEEDDDFLFPASTGRKIPRVIPEKPRASISELLELSQKEDELDSASRGGSAKRVEPSTPTASETDANKKEILRISQSFNRELSIDDAIESSFKELMEETEVPVLDDLTQTLKPEQNFHDARTVKFPDKGGTTTLKGGTASLKSSPSKKRFVTSFEDFEAGFRKIEDEEKRRHKEEKQGKMVKGPTTLKDASKEVLPPENSEVVSTADISKTGSHRNSRESREYVAEPQDESSKRASSEGKSTRHSEEKHLQTDTSVAQEIGDIKPIQVDARRKYRRKTKQFVVEQDSEEVIECTKENDSEKFVGVSQELGDKLADFDAEIEAIKKDIETSQTLDTKTETRDHMSLEQLTRELEGSADSPVIVEASSETTKQKKTKRKTKPVELEGTVEKSMSKKKSRQRKSSKGSSRKSKLRKEEALDEDLIESNAMEKLTATLSKKVGSKSRRGRSKGFQDSSKVYPPESSQLEVDTVHIEQTMDVSVSVIEKEQEEPVPKRKRHRDKHKKKKHSVAASDSKDTRKESSEAKTGKASAKRDKSRKHKKDHKLLGNESKARTELVEMPSETQIDVLPNDAEKPTPRRGRSKKHEEEIMDSEEIPDVSTDLTVLEELGSKSRKSRSKKDAKSEEQPISVESSLPGLLNDIVTDEHSIVEKSKATKEEEVISESSNKETHSDVLVEPVVEGAKDIAAETLQKVSKHRRGRSHNHSNKEEASAPLEKPSVEMIEPDAKLEEVVVVPETTQQKKDDTLEIANLESAEIVNVPAPAVKRQRSRRRTKETAVAAAEVEAKESETFLHQESIQLQPTLTEDIVESPKLPNEHSTPAELMDVPIPASKRQKYQRHVKEKPIATAEVKAKEPGLSELNTDSDSVQSKPIEDVTKHFKLPEEPKESTDILEEKRPKSRRHTKEKTVTALETEAIVSEERSSKVRRGRSRKSTKDEEMLPTVENTAVVDESKGESQIPSVLAASQVSGTEKGLSEPDAESTKSDVLNWESEYVIEAAKESHSNEAVSTTDVLPRTFQELEVSQSENTNTATLITETVESILPEQIPEVLPEKPRTKRRRGKTRWDTGETTFSAPAVLEMSESKSVDIAVVAAQVESTAVPPIELKLSDIADTAVVAEAAAQIESTAVAPVESIPTDSFETAVVAEIPFDIGSIPLPGESVPVVPALPEPTVEIKDKSSSKRRRGKSWWHTQEESTVEASLKKPEEILNVKGVNIPKEDEKLTKPAEAESIEPLNSAPESLQAIEKPLESFIEKPVETAIEKPIVPVIEELLEPTFEKSEDPVFGKSEEPVIEESVKLITQESAEHFAREFSEPSKEDTYQTEQKSMEQQEILTDSATSKGRKSKSRKHTVERIAILEEPDKSITAFDTQPFEKVGKTGELDLKPRRGRSGNATRKKDTNEYLLREELAVIEHSETRIPEDIELPKSESESLKKHKRGRKYSKEILPAQDFIGPNQSDVEIPISQPVAETSEKEDTTVAVPHDIELPKREEESKKHRQARKHNKETLSAQYFMEPNAEILNSQPAAKTSEKEDAVVAAIQEQSIVIEPSDVIPQDTELPKSDKESKKHKRDRKHSKERNQSDAENVISQPVEETSEKEDAIVAAIQEQCLATEPSDVILEDIELPKSKKEAEKQKRSRKGRKEALPAQIVLLESYQPCADTPFSQPTVKAAKESSEREEKIVDAVSGTSLQEQSAAIEPSEITVPEDVPSSQREKELKKQKRGRKHSRELEIKDSPIQDLFESSHSLADIPIPQSTEEASKIDNTTLQSEIRFTESSSRSRKDRKRKHVDEIDVTYNKDESSVTKDSYYDTKEARRERRRSRSHKKDRYSYKSEMSEAIQPDAPIGEPSVQVYQSQESKEILPPSSLLEEMELSETGLKHLEVDENSTHVNKNILKSSGARKLDSAAYTGVISDTFYGKNSQEGRSGRAKSSRRRWDVISFPDCHQSDATASSSEVSVDSGNENLKEAVAEDGVSLPNVAIVESQPTMEIDSVESPKGMITEDALSLPKFCNEEIQSAAFDVEPAPIEITTEDKKDDEGKVADLMLESSSTDTQTQECEAPKEERSPSQAELRDFDIETQTTEEVKQSEGMELPLHVTCDIADVRQDIKQHEQSPKRDIGDLQISTVEAAEVVTDLDTYPGLNEDVSSKNAAVVESTDESQRVTDENSSEVLVESDTKLLPLETERTTDAQSIDLQGSKDELPVVNAQQEVLDTTANIAETSVEMSSEIEEKQYQEEPGTVTEDHPLAESELPSAVESQIETPELQPSTDVQESCQITDIKNPIEVPSAPVEDVPVKVPESDEGKSTETVLSESIVADVPAREEKHVEPLKVTATYFVQTSFNEESVKAVSKKGKGGRSRKSSRSKCIIIKNKDNLFPEDSDADKLDIKEKLAEIIERTIEESLERTSESTGVKYDTISQTQFDFSSPGIHDNINNSSVPLDVQKPQEISRATDLSTVTDQTIGDNDKLVESSARTEQESKELIAGNEPLSTTLDESNEHAAYKDKKGRRSKRYSFGLDYGTSYTLEPLEETRRGRRHRKPSRETEFLVEQTPQDSLILGDGTVENLEQVPEEGPKQSSVRGKRGRPRKYSRQEDTSIQNLEAPVDNLSEISKAEVMDQYGQAEAKTDPLELGLSEGHHSRDALENRRHRRPTRETEFLVEETPQDPLILGDTIVEKLEQVPEEEPIESSVRCKRGRLRIYSTHESTSTQELEAPVDHSSEISKAEVADQCDQVEAKTDSIEPALSEGHHTHRKPSIETELLVEEPPQDSLILGDAIVEKLEQVPEEPKESPVRGKRGRPRKFSGTSTQELEAPVAYSTEISKAEVVDEYGQVEAKTDSLELPLSEGHHTYRKPSRETALLVEEPPQDSSMLGDAIVEELEQVPEEKPKESSVPGKRGRPRKYSSQESTSAQDPEAPVDHSSEISKVEVEDQYGQAEAKTDPLELDLSEGHHSTDATKNRGHRKPSIETELLLEETPQDSLILGDIIAEKLEQVPEEEPKETRIRGKRGRPRKYSREESTSTQDAEAPVDHLSEISQTEVGDQYDQAEAKTDPLELALSDGHHSTDATKNRGHRKPSRETGLLVEETPQNSLILGDAIAEKLEQVPEEEPKEFDVRGKRGRPRKYSREESISTQNLEAPVDYSSKISKTEVEDQCGQAEAKTDPLELDLSQGHYSRDDTENRRHRKPSRETELLVEETLQGSLILGDAIAEKLEQVPEEEPKESHVRGKRGRPRKYSRELSISNQDLEAPVDYSSEISKTEVEDQCGQAETKTDPLELDLSQGHHSKDDTTNRRHRKPSRETELLVEETPQEEPKESHVRGKRGRPRKYSRQESTPSQDPEAPADNSSEISKAEIVDDYNQAETRTVSLEPALSEGYHSRDAIENRRHGKPSRETEFLCEETPQDSVIVGDATARDLEPVPEEEPKESAIRGKRGRPRKYSRQDSTSTQDPEAPADNSSEISKPEIVDEYNQAETRTVSLVPTLSEDCHSRDVIENRRHRKPSGESEFLVEETPQDPLLLGDVIAEKLEPVPEEESKESLVRGKRGRPRKCSRRESTSTQDPEAPGDNLTENSKEELVDQYGQVEVKTDPLELVLSEGHHSRDVEKKGKGRPRKYSKVDADDKTDQVQPTCESFQSETKAAELSSSIASESFDEKDKFMPLKKNRWPRRGSYAKKETDVEHDLVVKDDVTQNIHQTTVIEKIALEEQAVSLESAVIEKTDPTSIETSTASSNDSELILPLKKSKRVNEVSSQLLQDSFFEGRISPEKKSDSDMLSFPSYDDSFMSTSLRNNIEGLIKEIDSIDNSLDMPSVGTEFKPFEVPETKTEETNIEHMFGNHSLVDDSRGVFKESNEIPKCVPPKKKKIDLPMDEAPTVSFVHQLQNDIPKIEEKVADSIPRPPKKKMQKLFENSQALEKLEKPQELPLMSPLAKKKSFLFHQEEFQQVHKSDDVPPQKDPEASKDVDKNSHLSKESVDSAEVNADEFISLPKARKKRKSSSYADYPTKKEKLDESAPFVQQQEHITKDPCSFDSSEISFQADQKPSTSTAPSEDLVSKKEHKNEMEVKLEDNDFKFNTETNLSNLLTTKAQEISAIAPKTLSEIHEEVTAEHATRTSTAPSKDVKDETVPQKTVTTASLETAVSSEPELVPISVAPTVMSEQDLADAQVEITTDKVISEKKSATVSTFSMDFSEPASKTDVVKTVKKETETVGTEFTSKAMVKEFDNRSLTSQPNTYVFKSELLDILEGNSNSSTNSSGSEQKFKTSFDNYDKKSTVQGIIDFEEAIPSQIVLSNKVNPESVLLDSPKLLERLSMSTDASKAKIQKVVIQSDIKVPEALSKTFMTKVGKPGGTPKPGQKIVIKTPRAPGGSGSKTFGSKPIILSEQIIRPANTTAVAGKSSVQPQGIKRQYEDVEDVETAFIIPKIAKKAEEEEEVVSPTPPEKPARSRAAKNSGKAKILQQTIITPKGEIIPQTSAAGQSIQLQPVQVQQAQDDSVFDINSMPIVLSDDLLTPESIQNMPVVLSDDVLAQSSTVPPVKGQEKLVTALPKKIVSTIGTKQIIFKTTQPASTTLVPPKHAGKARILSTSTAASHVKVPKPGTTALLATGTTPDGKPAKYVLVPPSVTSTTTQVKTVKQAVVKKQPVVQSKITSPSNLAPVADQSNQIVGNKIMIVTNAQGQQTRVVLTPQQQKAFMQAQTGSKTKAIIKGAIPKALLESAAAVAAAGPSGVAVKTVPAVPQGVAPQISSHGGLLMPAVKSVKPPAPPKKSAQRSGSTKPQKTILIKNQLGQTVRKIQGTDDADLDRQVAEQLEAIKASARLQQANKSPEIINYTNRQIPATTTSSSGASHRSTVRRSYAKKVEPPKIKIPVSSPQVDTQKAQEGSVPALAPLSPQPRVPQVVQNQSPQNTPKQVSTKKVELPAPTSSTVTKSLDSILQQQRQQTTVPVKSDSKEPAGSSKETENKRPESPLRQVVIQDGLGNLTTVTVGQILAIPSETVDGQPQSYMLVTVDESGNLTPLNNDALMSLDPSLGAGGDLNNMVLQVDQGQATVAAIKPAESGASGLPVLPVPVEEKRKVEERLKPEPPKPLPQPVVKERKVAHAEQPKPQEVPLAVEQQIVIGEGVLPGDAGGQQLIVTGDPIATQKFLESLSDGSTDLANILANAEGGSVLIQADGQQILIRTNPNAQPMMGVTESTEGGGNPIFATHKPNQDILAAALANTDVFQPTDAHGNQSLSVKGLQSSQLSPGGGPGLYPMQVGNVLETSLTLSSPIMTPLEVPSTNSKKIDDEADILNQVPKNVDLPITITDPNISQTVAHQQAAGLMELTLPIPETIPSTDISSPSSYSYSLPTLDDSVGISQKPFSSSMPLLTEDVVEVENSNSSNVSRIRVSKNLERTTSSFGRSFGSLPILSETIESSREEVVKTSTFGDIGSLPMLTDDVIEDSGSSIGSTKPPRSSPKPIERDIVDEGLSTLGGEMCSSLSEPPPDMFDLSSITTSKEEEISSDISSIPEPETLSINSENSGEIPIQPPIVANLNDLKRSGEDTDGSDDKRPRFD